MSLRMPNLFAAFGGFLETSANRRYLDAGRLRQARLLLAPGRLPLVSRAWSV
ncbi:hypothetical protein B0G73_12966 [Paraburkholderia sp. BL25I1N1]|nr:hypothetical protein B0G73_12966 [Paraburkholderia sp. BL25I1N1]